MAELNQAEAQGKGKGRAYGKRPDEDVPMTDDEAEVDQLQQLAMGLPSPILNACAFSDGTYPASMMMSLVRITTSIADCDEREDHVVWAKQNEKGDQNYNHDDQSHQDDQNDQNHEHEEGSCSD